VGSFWANCFKHMAVTVSIMLLVTVLDDPIYSRRSSSGIVIR
jgi:hypothetical protein